ncbi:MAG: putative phosphoenolpyruvate synthase [Candidatus Woesearchaeota archaeon]|nr:putative phosphoenolpyruvate synthase [Candidatus Woesearchaeota archaeon]
MKLAVNEIGNKAKNLLLLKNSYNVPAFFSIPSNEIYKILEKIGISKNEINKAFDNDSKNRQLIRDKIIKSGLNLNFLNLNELDKKLIVRSSALGEDGKKHSFAGIYESKITENNKQFEEDFKYVLSSAFSERVWNYCKLIGMNTFPEISLIVQNYIDPEYSGITFTQTEYNNKKGMLINAVKGHGENAVLGKGVNEIFIQYNKIPKNNIPNKILKEVTQNCRKIESYFNKPQDIEWCYANDKLWILQSRAITKNVHEQINVWDNSNIAESYSGIVLPLTCSFAKFIYTQVYRDLAITSNINPRKIEKYSDVFENLLGFFYGRFYYNILNWYKMLTLFPGYERNKRNLDMMISAKNRAELNKEHHQNVNLIDKLRYYPYIIYRIFRFEKDIRKFKKDVKNYLRHAKENNFEQAELNKLWMWFEDFQENLLKKWSITVDNDFLAMTWFGFFKKYAKRYGLNDSQILSQITSIKSLVSAQQVNALRNLSEEFYKNNKLITLAKNSNWNLCYKEMMNDVSLNNLIEEYLSLYGGRFANELKLEAKDLDSDPEFLPQLLYQYKTRNKKKTLNGEKINLPFYKGLVLNILSKRSKHYLKHREELRLLRSQAFSYTRRLFIAIGKKLETKRIIDNFNDIFYLKLDEIETAIKNDNSELKEIIVRRKKEYAEYEKVELGNVLVTRGNELPKQKDFKKIKCSKQLKGIGCSSGIVSGKITVMHEFKLPKKPLEIVVVKHTDPGWTPLFGICKGLIVENGGLLSHAAIISRELNLPCIIGVENATKLLKDGQNINMDGNTGKISIE